MNTADRRERLIEELKNKEYRNAFVSSNVDVGVAFQIRAMRKQRQWSQEKLAEMAHMKQERISALENPNKAPSISTLKKLATAFDVGLMVRFVPISELLEWKLKLSSTSLEAESYEDDFYFKIQQEDILSKVSEALEAPGQRIYLAYNSAREEFKKAPQPEELYGSKQVDNVTAGGVR